MANGILWGNTASWEHPQIFEDDGGQVSVTHSCVEGGWPGTGNFDDDPMLADADGSDDVFGTADDDVHLLDPDSPCIDAGDNSAVPADAVDLDGDGDTSEPIPIDLDGNARIRNHPCVPDTGMGGLRVVDVGVFEIQYPLRSDLDEDGDVDLADFALFLQEFTGPQ